jgi:hypothetical protein
MSDDRGSNWVGPFVLGFLLGVLLCLGGGGAVLMSWQRSLAMEARDARMVEEMARRDAEMQRARAEEVLARLEKELREAKERKK